MNLKTWGQNCLKPKATAYKDYTCW